MRAGPTPARLGSVSRGPGFPRPREAKNFEPFLSKAADIVCVAVANTYGVQWIFADVRADEKVFFTSPFSVPCSRTLREHLLAGYKGRVSFCERRSTHFDPQSGFQCPQHQEEVPINRYAVFALSVLSTGSACALASTLARLTNPGAPRERQRGQGA